MRNKRTPEGKINYFPGFSVPIRILFIQLIAFGLTLFVVQLAIRLLGIETNTLVFGLIQGVFALLMTYLLRMRRWWLPIQFIFPLAMFLLLALDIAPIWYLGAFAVLLFLFWGAVVTRVPLYLSGNQTWEKVLELLPKDRPLNIVDIGSGLGGLVLYLAKNRPDSRVFGIEISPFLWFVSHFRRLFAKSEARFMFGNYERLDFSQYDVVFAYLSPIVMDNLWSKVQSEMRLGSLFLSFEFIVEGAKPDIEIEVGNKVLFGWKIVK